MLVREKNYGYNEKQTIGKEKIAVRKHYKMTVSYDGTRYNGWQRQKGTLDTVQGKIETVLGRLSGDFIEVRGSGRTDRGVHALGQVADFFIEENSEQEAVGSAALTDYLNRYLPEDIFVKNMEEVEENFHSRLWAKRKTYLYRLGMGGARNVFERRYQYTIEEVLDVDRMRRAAGYLVGEHDFAGFCTHAPKKKSTCRTIFSVMIMQEGDFLNIFITGNGFLYNMVRIITGTLVEVGMGKRAPESVMEILEKKDRGLAGITMPAKGLTLYSVEY